MDKIVAKALIINKDGKLLLLFRGDSHPNFPGHLDLPGGEVEGHEHWEDAVAREIREETDIVVPLSKLTKAFEKTRPDVTHVLYLTEIDETNPTIKLSWEHRDFKWYEKEALLNEPLPKSADPYYADVIEYLRSI